MTIAPRATTSSVRCRRGALRTSSRTLAVIAAAALGCGTGQGSTRDADADAARDAARDDVSADVTPTDAPAGDALVSVQDVRGDRYCEILLGTLAGGQVHLEVYNTYGLNDCPAQAWSAIDAAQLRTELAVAVVSLNGPRYWVMDAFANSGLVDPTVRALGGIPMRLAGTLDLPLSEAMASGQPYTPRNVARTTTWVFAAGQPVYELVDPAGRVFDMQSYSVQRAALTADALPGLATQLTLPTGWTFRSRVLASELRVTAIDGVATVVQDDLANTYQLSQP